MKMVYVILVIIIAAVVIYNFSKGKRDNTTDSTSKVATKQLKDTSQQDKENPYEGLRNMVLSLTPDQLQLRLVENETKVYEVVMDWGLDKGYATIVASIIGDASFYLSSGGGMIGSGQHENVSTAAKAFVDKAQMYLSKTHKTETTPLPARNSVRFYLLTNKGKFTAYEQMQNFENRSSIWLPLFEEGNKVLSEIRLHYEDGQPLERK